jgi:hypothetical protein
VTKAKEAGEMKLTGLDLHVSRIDYAGNSAELIPILKGERSAYAAKQAIKLVGPREGRFPKFKDADKRRLDDLKNQYAKESRNYQSFQLEMSRRQFGPVDRVANNLGLLAGYERLVGDLKAEIEDIELREKEAWDIGRSHDAIVSILKLRAADESPRDALAVQFDIPIDDLLSERDRLRIRSAADAEKEAKAQFNADLLARAEANEQAALESAARDSQELVDVETWSVEQMLVYAFYGNPRAQVFYYFLPSELHQGSVSDALNAVKGGLREASDSIAGGHDSHMTRMRLRCFARLHEILDPSDHDYLRGRCLHSVKFYDSQKEQKNALKAAVASSQDPEVLAVDEWPIEQLIVHVFGENPPTIIQNEFLATRPGYEDRFKVRSFLQEREGKGDLVFQRALTRLASVHETNQSIASQQRAGTIARTY